MSAPFLQRSCILSAICESAVFKPREHTLRRRLRIGEDVGQRQLAGLGIRIPDPREKGGIAVLDSQVRRVDDDDAVVRLIDDGLVARVDRESDAENSASTR